jgi:HEAT repeat protein
VFISYSWDDAAHKDWVREFAARLTRDGVKVTLDQWHAVPGDQLPKFMEGVIRRSKFVLIICTPRYKKRADKRVGGVGYEGDIMTAEVFSKKSFRRQRKFIPILRAGTWEQAAPTWLTGKYRIHLDGEPYSEENYQDLLSTLHDARPTPPPLGPRPEKYRIQELCKHLKSSDVFERRFAMLSLVRIGPAAVPGLAAALKDAPAEVRRWAASTLERMGPAAVPALAAALKDDDIWVRRRAASALRAIGPRAEAAVSALAAALKGDDDAVRRWAASVLGRIGPEAESAVSILAAALKDDAASALGAIGPAAVPALAVALKDDDTGVRRSAADALRKMGPAAKAAVPALDAALKDDDARVRQSAAKALEVIGPASSDTA